MNKKLTYILGLICIIFFTSCEDIIDLDLANSEPRVVIEAVADMNTSTIVVDVSLTTEFFGEAIPNQVTDANIIFRNAAGEEIEVPVGADGRYTLSPINVVSGETYEIEVTVDDVTYRAETEAPFPVDLLAVDTIFNEPFFEGGDPFYQSLYIWQDAPGQENHYQLRTFANDTLVGPFAYYDDDGLDGQTFVRPLMYPVEVGDTVRFQLLSIDEETYDYFIQLESALNQGFNSTTPFNPTGNFDNDGLGYFGINVYNELMIQF